MLLIFMTNQMCACSNSTTKRPSQLHGHATMDDVTNRAPSYPLYACYNLQLLHQPGRGDTFTCSERDSSIFYLNV